MNPFKLIEQHGLQLHGDIEHFAELVAQAEREACMRAIQVVKDDLYIGGPEWDALENARTIIRARGEA